MNNQENETTLAEHSHANYSMAQVKFVYYTFMLELHAIRCKYDYIHIIETLILPWKPQDCVWLVIAAHISHSNIEPLAACCKCHLIILSLLPRPYGVGKRTSYLLLTSHVCEWLHHNLIQLITVLGTRPLFPTPHGLGTRLDGTIATWYKREPEVTSNAYSYPVPRLNIIVTQSTFINYKQ